MEYNRYSVTYTVNNTQQVKATIIAPNMESVAEYLETIDGAEPTNMTLVEENAVVVEGGDTPVTAYVESFNGRSGAVVPEAGDYTVDQITGSASEADLTTLEGRVDTAESDITTNTTNITTNSNGITTLEGRITTAESGISTNASNITTNANGVSTNESDIASNAVTITNNTSNISTNASGIASNAVDITNNATNIATNSSNISSLQTTKLDASAPTVDAEVKTIKVNETTDTADVAGAGAIRYNTTDSTIEYSDGTDWKAPSTGGSTSEAVGITFKPLTVGYAGDSISAQWAGEDGYSGMFWYTNLFNPCMIENIFTTSKGGSPSSALISEYDSTTAQIEVLEALDGADVPDLMIVHTTQNDYFGTATNAEDEALNVTTYCERALVKGVTNIIVFGHPPKSGTDEPTQLTYLNRILQSYAESTDGVHFIDVLNIWRAIPTGYDASGGGIDWREGYSSDGTHPSTKAMYEAGKLLDKVLRPLVQGKGLQPTTSKAYDDTDAPYNNLLEGNGLMWGTNGTYNAVDDANVAGISTSSRWALTDENGVTATPSLITGDDGYTYQQLVLGGTATDDADVYLKYSFSKNPITLGTFVQECILHLNDITGVELIQCGIDNIAQKGITNYNQDLEGENILHLTHTAEYEQDSWSTRTFTLRVKVPSGESPTGTIKLGRVGLYRQVPKS